MTLQRTLDATQLNAAANHPKVRPHLGWNAPGDLDLTPIVSDPRNIALSGKHGGFILQWLSEGTYEVHSIFTPDGRRGLSRVTADWLGYVFIRTDATKVLTKVPTYNAAAAALAKAAGFTPIFTRKEAWRTPDGELCDVDYLSLTFDQWRARDMTFRQAGEWFHDKLELAKRKAGSPLPVHPEDEAHDRAVGAAVQMLRVGNAEKAVRLYNEWALFAGYAPIILVSLNPTVIDLQDAVVEVRNFDMEILLCR